MNKIDRRVGSLLFILILIIMPGFTLDGKDGFNRYSYKDGTFYKIYVTTVKEYFYFTDTSTFAEIEWDKLNAIVLASKQEKIDLERKEQKEKEKQLATKANESKESNEAPKSEQPKEEKNPKADSNQPAQSNKKVEEKQQSNQQQTTKKEEKQTEPKQETKKEPNKEENTSANSFEQEVVRLTNMEREKHGLPSLKLDAKLAEVAREKSEDMAVNQYFSHDSPTYGSPFDMMNRYGITYSSAGENIAKGQRTPEEVVQAWMNSDGHRANILNASFTHIGVGFEQGNRIWTQQFIGK